MDTLKSTLLFLSKNKLVERTVMGFEFCRNAAERFVPGEKLEDAIEATRELNSMGIAATIDHLGESVEDEDIARRSADAYLEILEEINRTGVTSGISVKPTHMGLGISYDLCKENIERIVAKAVQLTKFVRIDMEDSPYTQQTLDIFKGIREKHSNVGIVLQAYLYRTENDVKEAVENGYNIRLCKGAYMEPSEIAYPKKSEVDRNFLHLLEILLSKRALENGTYTAVGTHDDKIIEWTKRFADQNGIGKDEFEFQMLYGIKRDLQEKLVKEGYQVRAYIPYGTHWYPYYVRRLAERPANLAFFFRCMLSD